VHTHIYLVYNLNGTGKTRFYPFLFPGMCHPGASATPDDLQEKKTTGASSTTLLDNKYMKTGRPMHVIPGEILFT